MIVELQRPDLLNLCKQVATTHLPDKGSRFEVAFERRDFVNGFHYRLSESWASEATDEQLLDFCIYHSTTIKKID